MSWAYGGRFARDENVVLYSNGGFVCPAYDSVNHCCGHWKKIPMNRLTLEAFGLEAVSTNLGPALVCKIETQLKEVKESEIITVFPSLNNLLP